MRKVRLFQRPDRPGWHVSWRENGKVRKRSFRTKKIAEHYQHFVYADLNRGVLQSIADMPMENLVSDYLKKYDLRGFTPRAKYEAGHTLKLLEEHAGSVSSKNITQRLLDDFILARGQTVGRWTLNKDISNLQSFLRWGKKRSVLNSELEVHKIKTDPRPVVKLTDGQVHNLLIAARDRSDCWYIRVLLAVTTGLRSGDLERIQIGDIDFEGEALLSQSQKTRKVMASRPLHSGIIHILANYMMELPDGQVRLLDGDSNTHKKWKAILQRAGLPGLRFHDLRSVFATSLQAHDVPLSVVQELLEHSSPALTQRFYTNVEALLRPAVERLPLANWLIES